MKMVAILSDETRISVWLLDEDQEPRFNAKFRLSEWQRAAYGVTAAWLCSTSSNVPPFLSVGLPQFKEVEETEGVITPKNFDPKRYL